LGAAVVVAGLLASGGRGTGFCDCDAAESAITRKIDPTKCTIDICLVGMPEIIGEAANMS
jgi:hypothetical protein